MRQLGRQKSGLQLVQAGVLSLINMVVFVVAAVVAQGADLLGQRIIIRCHAACIAQRPQILARVEAEAGQVSQRSHISARRPL